MKSKNIIILGGHGDGELVAWALHDIQGVKGIGWLNDHEKEGTLIAELPVLGRIDEDTIGCLLDDPRTLLITALQKVKHSEERLRKIRNLKIPPERFYTLIHPSAYVAPNVKIGYDTFVGFHVCIMANAVIGNHCSFRSSAHIGHDWVIRDGCFVGPNASLLGRGFLGEGVHIGPNVSVKESINIGDYAIVGMGSVVTKDIPAYQIAVGSPAEQLVRDKRNEMTEVK